MENKTLGLFFSSSNWILACLIPRLSKVRPSDERANVWNSCRKNGRLGGTTGRVMFTWQTLERAVRKHKSGNLGLRLCAEGNPVDPIAAGSGLGVHLDPQLWRIPVLWIGLLSQCNENTLFWIWWCLQTYKAASSELWWNIESGNRGLGLCADRNQPSDKVAEVAITSCCRQVKAVTSKFLSD